MGRKPPELEAFEERALLFSQEAGDGRQAPVLVRFVKLSHADAQVVQPSTKGYQLLLIANCQVDVGRVPFGSGATEGVSVLNRSVGGLNSLLREWEIAAGDGVQVSVAGLHAHDKLRLKLRRIYVRQDDCITTVAACKQA